MLNYIYKHKLEAGAVATFAALTALAQPQTLVQYLVYGAYNAGVVGAAYGLYQKRGVIFAAASNGLTALFNLGRKADVVDSTQQNAPAPVEPEAAFLESYDESAEFEPAPAPAGNKVKTVLFELRAHVVDYSKQKALPAPVEPEAASVAFAESYDESAEYVADSAQQNNVYSENTQESSQQTRSPAISSDDPSSFDLSSDDFDLGQSSEDTTLRRSTRKASHRATINMSANNKSKYGRILR